MQKAQCSSEACASVKCEHTVEDKDALPEELVRLVKELLLMRLPLWLLSPQLESVSVPTS